MFAGVSGLRNHQVKMDVIGNNIANVNTTGFKAGRVTFQDMLAQTLRGGTAPQAGGAGGINPAQIGLGMIIGTIDTLHTQGNLGTTGKSTDMAIQGEGFFVMSDGETVRYSRDGTFDIGQDSTLVNPASGFRVQGWMANNNVIDTTAPVQDIYIPVGAELVAQATSSIDVVGNLDAGGSVATTGTVANSGALHSAAATAAIGTTLLSALTDNAGTANYLDVGDTITINAKKNGIAITPVTLTVTAATTVNDLAAAIQNGCGIVNDLIAGDGAGVAVNGSGQIVLTGNYGEANAITELFITSDAGSGTSNAAAFSAAMAPSSSNGFAQTAAADGESLMSTMIGYDSLGVAHTINVYFAKDANNSWTWNADCDDASTSTINVGRGTIDFTELGAYSVDAGFISMTLDNGAETPLDIDLDLSNVTQFSKDSSISVRDQNGFPAGTLEKFSIGADGIITGIYTNGLTDELGQVALARFANAGGLLKEGNNLYAQSTNSGVAQVGAAGSGGRGYINNGVLELSNVDLPQSFTDMIITQRGFQANARIITTSDDMLQELVNLKR